MRHFLASQSGIGYLAILILLAILSSLTFAFLFTVGTRSSATMNRSNGMEAAYLAESASNHALWHLLNDPGFNPDPDTYSMHSFANGRYGYKVRKPTETTFATVATVGAIQDNVVNQSYVQYIVPSNILTGYGTSSSPVPKYRRLIGAQWTASADMATGAAPTVSWTELEGCPVRKELIGGVLDSNDDITLNVWRDGAWSKMQTLATTADRNYKCFDIAYESHSGRALIVGRTDATATVRYELWDGSNWAFSSPQPAFNLADGTLRLVVMASCPGNDQILIGTVNSLFDLQLFLWDGSGFTDLGVVETSTWSDQPGNVQIVYERQSGNALVLWTRWGSPAIFCVWNGVTLSSESVIPVFSDNMYFLRAAGDPTSDHIIVAGVDKFYDVHVGIWNGTAWTDSREVETDNANNARQGVDVAWEATGDDALVVWSPWNAGVSIVRSLAWKKGTTLADSTIAQGPDIQGQPWLVRLLPISQSQKIILLVEDNTNNLHYSLWDGERLKGDPSILLESNISATNQLAFDLAEADVPISGGIGSGIPVNQPPTVNAGTDETIYLPTDHVNLNGTVTDDGLPNPPGAVTTTWSMVSGPGTVTFDDASLVDTTAAFSQKGTYVLRLTADDSDLTAFDEVTIIVDSCNLLLVVADASSLSSGETARKSMIEGWGWTVNLISDHATQEAFDTETATVEVAYIPTTINATMLSTKLRGTTIGVVIEKIMPDFGIATGWGFKSSDEIKIIDNANYITSPFDLGLLTFVSSIQPITKIDGGVAPGLITLAEVFNVGSIWKPALAIVDTGGELSGGGTAAGRRVQLPWGDETFDFNALNTDGQTIMKRAIEWAAHKEGGCGCAAGCSGDYTPDTKMGEFSTAAYGSTSIEGVCYLPEGKSFNFTAAPSGGALISVDMNDQFYMTDLSGNLLTSLAAPSGTDTGVSFVETGTWANHLAVSDKFSDEIQFFDLSGNLAGSFSTNVSADFDGTTPEGVAFIGVTASGTYDNHLAIPDLGRNKVYLVDQSGNWVSSIDISGIMSNVKGVVHLPGTDKLLLIDMGGQAFVVDFSGNVLSQYDTAPFGTSSPTDITINPLTCDHLVADGTTDLIVTLNLSGSDTSPPNPDPMTWASPPLADGPYSIRMTATTAADPSGVEYYFACTAGGGNDSGWQDSPTYADTGLSPATSYTYRVKARDKSSGQNETGWSTEASAATSSNEIYVYDITMGFGTAPGSKFFGRATVWIKSASGQNISGATVSGDWSGAVSESGMGSTGSDGKVTLESSNVKNGGTFAFTVTSVAEAGYTYNASLNVKTSDSITAP